MTHPARKRPSGTTRIALVGAGFIAQVHLQALRSVRGVEVTAVCDSDPGRAGRLARQAGAQVFTDLAEMLASGTCDAVHLLVPPLLHHRLAKQCLEAGVHVLVEKPLAMCPQEAEELGALAEAQGVLLGVNHNLTFDPCIERLRKAIKKGQLGRLEHLTVIHHVPLRQLQSGDVGHFMFQGESRILWEQGVHPFSIVESLLGKVLRTRASTTDPIALPHGVPFRDTWFVDLECERGTAQVMLAFGRTMMERRVIALGSDGAMSLDLERGNAQRLAKSRWLEFMDNGLNGIRQGFGLGWQGMGAFAGYGLALFKLVPPSEPFFRGMIGALRSFHGALRSGGEYPCGAEAGAEVLRTCEAAARAAGASTDVQDPPTFADPGPARDREVAITGGTGFLGKHLVAQLLDQGRNVTLLVRRPEKLPLELRDPRLRLLRGDAADPEALDRLAQGADVVLHMATCAGGSDDETVRAMGDAMQAVGDACKKHAVRRLVFVSSTAALYLGGSEPVTGASGPDPQPDARPVYSRGKIQAEKVLEKLQGEGVETVCLRPAIVVGEGGMAEHSGVGLWVRDNHAVGWGMGKNPLPFVLVEDCAAAVVAALDAPEAANKAYNLAGDVRWSARRYFDELRKATGRAFHYHAQPVWLLWTAEMGKHFVKVVARRPRVAPSKRDFLSRGFFAPLDCGDAKRDLDWKPCADEARFYERALVVHAPVDRRPQGDSAVAPAPSTTPAPTPVNG